MKFLRRKVWLLGSVPCAVLALAAVGRGEEPPDWRLEFLAEEGYSSETEALRELSKAFDISFDGLDSAYERLGADDFGERERAEWEILEMGKEVRPLLRRLPVSDDLEVRLRMARIEQLHQSEGRWARRDLLRQAATSLLEEREGAEGKKQTPFVYAEFFKEESPSLEKGYRNFRFEADEKMKGLVSGGRLRMKGDRNGDGDQQLLLAAKALTGKEEFPEAFRIEVKVGGESGGSGAYHVGVSFGNVRALFHPGYRSGGFRLEKVDSSEYIVPNKDMGFDPSTDRLQSMSVDVKRLAKGDVELNITVSDGSNVFAHRKVVQAKDIGPLSHIGLDRSGRTGGDAVFDDLVVELPPSE